MRALFRDLLKGQGTPVLQTHGVDGESILSAGNIWTSAHARRIALRDEGAKPGDVLCSPRGGFEAVIDFVACAIGGFVHVPVDAGTFAILHGQMNTQRMAGAVGVVFVDEEGMRERHGSALPALLAPLEDAPGALFGLINRDRPGGMRRLQVYTSEKIEQRLRDGLKKAVVEEGSARITCDTCHYEEAFLDDLLLGLFHRQTIYLRSPDAIRGALIGARSQGLKALERVG